MGNFWENSEIKKEEVEKNIIDVNEITKSAIFMNKYKLHLVFQLDDSPIQKINKKIIKVNISEYDQKSCFVNRREDSLFITIDEFYQYYNLLMNLRGKFLNDQMKKNMDNLTKSQIIEYGEDESGICPICCENNVDMALPCSHFFCENCIKTWLVKSESCPLCRYKLQVNKKTPSGVEGAQSWDVIEEVDEEQLAKESEQTLRSLTKKLFSDNQNKK